MNILPDFASASYSQFPAAQLMLPAPRIAGLLSARVPSSQQVIVTKPRESLLDRQRAIWAAQDAELEEFLIGARQRIAAVIAEIEHDRTTRRPYLWEITS